MAGENEQAGAGAETPVSGAGAAKSGQEGAQGGAQGADAAKGGDKGGEGEKGSKSLLGGAQGEDEGKGKEGEQAGEKGAGGVPETYVVKVPEGTQVDQALIDSLTPILKENKVSQEAFQKIADVYATRVQAMQAESSKAMAGEFAKTVSEWQEETKKDHGASLKEVLSYGARAIDKLGSVRLREVLDDTGLGNHPEMVKFFSRVGRMISEDSFVDPETHPSSFQGPDLKKMYPSMEGKSE